MSKIKHSTNLLELIPVKNIRYETTEKKLVTILKPKFKNKFLAKYLIPKSKSPNYHIHLDEFGTAVWNHIDGKNTVQQIGNLLKQEFGEDIEPVYERLGMFIRTLKSNKFITYYNYQ